MVASHHGRSFDVTPATTPGPQRRRGVNRPPSWRHAVLGKNGKLTPDHDREASPGSVHVVTPGGKESEFLADEIDRPNNEMGFVRFKLVGLEPPNRFAGWWTSPPEQR